MFWYKIVVSLIRINVSVCRKCSQWCSYWTQKYFGAFDLCAVFFSNCWKHRLCPLFLQPLFLPFLITSPHLCPHHTTPPSPIFHTLPTPHPSAPLPLWLVSVSRQTRRCGVRRPAGSAARSALRLWTMSAATCWPWTWRDWKWLPCWWSWSSSSRFWSGLVCWQPATTVSKGGGDVFSGEEPLVAEV